MEKITQNKYKVGTIIQHIKRGTVYEIIGVGYIESTLVPAYNYKCFQTDIEWFRAISEIEDINRFKVLATTRITINTPSKVGMIVLDSARVTPIGIVRSSTDDKSIIELFNSSIINKINNGTLLSYSMGSNNSTNNDSLKMQFTVTPNVYKSATEENKTPIHNEADKYIKRRDQVSSFVTKLGWENNPIGKGIIKLLDEKIALNTTKPTIPEPTPTTVAPVQPTPKPDVITASDKDIEAWKTMTPAEKLQWCKTNLGMSSVVNKIINRANNYSTIMGGSANVIPSQSSTIIGNSNHTFVDAKKVVDPLVKSVSDIKVADIRESAIKVDKIVSIKREPEKKAQLTTKINLTVDYIRNEVMPTLHNYSLHEVDAFSALFAKFRKDPEYVVALTVLDRSIFKMTPEIAVNMVVGLYDQGHLK